MFVPAAVSGLLVSSWGDKIGRKVALAVPTAGMALSNAVMSVSIYFR